MLEETTTAKVVETEVAATAATILDLEATAASRGVLMRWSKLHVLLSTTARYSTRDPALRDPVSKVASNLMPAAGLIAREGPQRAVFAACMTCVLNGVESMEFLAAARMAAAPAAKLRWPWKMAGAAQTAAAVQWWWCLLRM